MKHDKVILAAIPNDPANNGEITYNSSLGKFRKKEGNVVTDLDTQAAGSNPRYAAYTAIVSTDANFSAIAGVSYSLPAATLTANRTIDLAAINTNADYLEFDNQEAGFTWTFINGNVYDAYENLITILAANTRYILRLSNGKIKIMN